MSRKIPWKSYCWYRYCTPHRVLGEKRTGSAQAPLGRRVHWKPPTITFISYQEKCTKDPFGLPERLKMPPHWVISKTEQQNWGYLLTR